jgi:hypothetical protein
MRRPDSHRDGVRHGDEGKRPIEFPSVGALQGNHSRRLALSSSHFSSDNPNDWFQGKGREQHKKHETGMLGSRPSV